MKQITSRIFLVLVLLRSTALNTWPEEQKPTIPPQIQVAIQEQIRDWLGTNSLAGIPYLDKATDWSQFKNWPNDFTFEGVEFRLVVSQQGSDWIKALGSRHEIRSNMNFAARYEAVGVEPKWDAPLHIAGSWRKDGSAIGQSVRTRNVEVFSLQFYPSGQVYTFSRQSRPAGVYREDFYDPAKHLLGQRSWPTKESRKAVYQWGDAKVDPDTFMVRLAPYARQCFNLK